MPSEVCQKIILSPRCIIPRPDTTFLEFHRLRRLHEFDNGMNFVWIQLSKGARRIRAETPRTAALRPSQQSRSRNAVPSSGARHIIRAYFHQSFKHSLRGSIAFSQLRPHLFRRRMSTRSPGCPGGRLLKLSEVSWECEMETLFPTGEWWSHLTKTPSRGSPFIVGGAAMIYGRIYGCLSSNFALQAIEYEVKATMERTDGRLKEFKIFDRCDL